MRTLGKVVISVMAAGMLLVVLLTAMGLLAGMVFVQMGSPHAAWQGMPGAGALGLPGLVGPALFVGVICLVLVFAFLAVRALSGAFAERNHEVNDEEVRQLQELNRGFARLEERVETLEALLLEDESGPGRRNEWHDRREN